MVLALGGATGPAMNPARDLGPRLAFHLLPIPGKVLQLAAYRVSVDRLPAAPLPCPARCRSQADPVSHIPSLSCAPPLRAPASLAHRSAGIL